MDMHQLSAVGPKSAPFKSLQPTCFTKGIAAEDAACRALQHDGWRIVGRRVRTAAGEVDAITDKDGLLAFVEVKFRRSLRQAAESLGPRQQRRLLASAEILLGANPEWGPRGVRFDVVVVNARNEVRRIADAFRLN